MPVSNCCGRFCDGTRACILVRPGKDILNAAILLATIAAIWLGPIKAVQITRRHDRQREERNRKLDVFTSLMKTRGFTLAPEHVMALNVVQVEFCDNSAVDVAYRKYLELLSRPFPKPGTEGAEHFFEQNEDALYDLLHAIGDDRGFKYDKRDLKKLAYGPVGWLDDESQIRAFRGLAVEVLAGRRALPVVDFAKLNGGASKFPPPPAT